MPKYIKKQDRKMFDFDSMIEGIKTTTIGESTESQDTYIPDILEFCYSPRYLNLSGKGIKLYPLQEVILKCFYRGQPGNTNIKLTDEEIELLREENHENVIEKYYSPETFRELILALGRRSGKDFIISLVALYETMRLMEIPGGDPLAFYNIADGQPIYILTIATAAEQAEILFREIKSKMHTSPYFRNKVGHLESREIWFMTHADKKKKQELMDAGIKAAADDIKGSIVVMAGHSNSDSLLGKRYFTLLFDEVASYKSSSSAQSGERLYAALAPGQSDFNQLVGNDADGKEIRRMDSKMISISSPRGEEGIFYKMYKESPFADNRLSFRFPTWKVNLRITEEMLRKEYKFMTEADFRMEFGAEFSGTSGERFISDYYVDKAFETGEKLGDAVAGFRGMGYYCHLDPATRSHNYALAVIHVEERLIVTENDRGVRKMDKKKYFIVDHIKVWTPTIKKEVDINEVDNYIIDLAKRFKFIMVTYDSWNSASSRQKLRKQGIPCKETPYRAKYKMAIYERLHNLLITETLVLPKKSAYALLTELELKNLKKIYNPKGFKIQPNKEGDVTTDDVCVHPETIIYTDSGPKQIQEVIIGDKVITHNGKFNKVTGISKHNNDIPCLSIKPFFSFAVKLTTNHPVLMNRNNKMEWIQAGEITKSDRFVIPVNRNTESFRIDLSKYLAQKSDKPHTKWNIKCSKKYGKHEFIKDYNPNANWHRRFIDSNKDFGYFLGVFCGEGSIGDHGICFGISKKEKYFYKRIRRTIEKIFGTKKLFSFSKAENNSLNITLNSNIIKKLMLDIFLGNKAIDKHLSNLIMNGNLDFQEGFIAGLFDGEGSYNKKQATFTTGSVKLAHQIQFLLYRFNIISSITISKRKGKKTKIENRTVTYNSDLYNIRIFDAASYNKLTKILNIRQKKPINKYRKSNYSFVDDYLFLNVNKIIKIPTEQIVCNLAVENDNSYIGGNISLHNCDAISGACGIATDYTYTGYPKMVNAKVPQFRGTSRSWNIGGGNYTDKQWTWMHRKFGY